MANSSKRCFVVSGPTGAGLSGIVSTLFSLRTDTGTVTPITSRKMKDSEENGTGFFFYDLEGWNGLKDAGDLLESTELAGNDYGTSRKLVNELLKEKNVLLNLSVERAAQLKKNMPEAICVYMEPSTAELLRERYAKTARNSFELAARMQLAKEQRELSTFCDYRIASDDINAAAQQLSNLIGQLTEE